MYSTCLFCHAPLGRNTTLEYSPHGRRFAFDRTRGRLWVICRTCHRWNLTPFEDRWEIIDECERRFRATQVRLSTDNIGLARLGDGTDLVRVGQPLRPEFAAWRYGRAFLSRRPLRAIHTLGGAGLLAAPVFLGALFGPVAPLALAGAAAVGAWRLTRRVAVSIDLSGAAELRLSTSQIQGAELIPDGASPDGWALLLDHLEDPNPLRRIGLSQRFAAERAVLTGLEARAAVTFVLPRLNPAGGSPGEVAEAVRWLEAVRGSDRAFATIARSHHVRPTLDSHKATLASMHTEVRLALEMAVHEEEEQRLLRGELSILERAWQREERLAAIADRLTVPEGVERQLADLRLAARRDPSRPPCSSHSQ